MYGSLASVVFLGCALRTGWWVAFTLMAPKNKRKTTDPDTGTGPAASADPSATAAAAATEDGTNQPAEKKVKDETADAETKTGGRAMRKRVPKAAPPTETESATDQKKSVKPKRAAKKTAAAKSESEVATSASEEKASDGESTAIKTGDGGGGAKTKASKLFNVSVEHCKS